MSLSFVGSMTLPRVTRAISSKTSGRAGFPTRSAATPWTKKDVSSVAFVCLQSSVTSCLPGSSAVKRLWKTPHSSPAERNRTVSALPEGATIRAVTSPFVSGSPLRSMTFACRASV